MCSDAISISLSRQVAIVTGGSRGLGCLGYESSRERLAAGLEIVAELCSGRQGVGPLVL